VIAQGNSAFQAASTLIKVNMTKELMIDITGVWDYGCYGDPLSKLGQGSVTIIHVIIEALN